MQSNKQGKITDLLHNGNIILKMAYYSNITEIQYSKLKPKGENL